MNEAAQLIVDFWTAQDVEIKLRTASGEFAGAGYKPQKIRGEWDGRRIVYPEPTFTFNSAAQPVTGYSAFIDGREIHRRDFDKPFPITGAGDWIRVSLAAKPKL